MLVSGEETSVVPREIWNPALREPRHFGFPLRVHAAGLRLVEVT